MAIKIGGLGKGLDAIFKENDLMPENCGEISLIRISEIEPNKKQPRSSFDETALSELADSIASKGVLQPLLVRPIDDNRYQIVAGERRWRAARMAGLTELPVIIRDLEDSEAMEIALIENLQREDLSVIEEAKGYEVLMEKYNLTQEDISQAVGKSRSAIANSLRLLKLPKNIVDMLESGSITAGHAKALLSLGSPTDMDMFAQEILKGHLSVRQLEKMIQNALKNKKRKYKGYSRESIYDEVEISLKEYLGRKVRVTGNKDKKGILQIEFFSEDDLMNLVRVLEA